MDDSANLSVAVVGYGYWGPNLVRNFSLAEGAIVSYVCDLDPKRLSKAAHQYPSARMTSKLGHVLHDPSVDLVALATPVSTHYPLAALALAAGKHVFIEKPLAKSVEEAQDLLRLAREYDRKIFVDHTFIFSPAVQKMKALFSSGDLGNARYYDSTRVNLGLFQHDVNVVWDLVTHDIAILDYLLDGKMPVAASCTGMAHFGGQADLAYLTLHYDDQFIAHINVNWLAPVKVRQVLLCGDRKMLVYDDNSASEKIKVYDSGVNVHKTQEIYQLLVQYRTGDMLAPRLDSGEALAYEVQNVIESLRGTGLPLCDGFVGARIVSVLEAADQSLRLGGERVTIEAPLTIAATMGEIELPRELTASEA